MLTLNNQESNCFNFEVKTLIYEHSHKLEEELSNTNSNFIQGSWNSVARVEAQDNTRKECYKLFLKDVEEALKSCIPGYKRKKAVVDKLFRTANEQFWVQVNSRVHTNTNISPAPSASKFASYARESKAEFIENEIQTAINRNTIGTLQWIVKKLRSIISSIFFLIFSYIKKYLP